MVHKWWRKTDFNHYENCTSLTLTGIRRSFKNAQCDDPSPVCNCRAVSVINSRKVIISEAGWGGDHTLATALSLMTPHDSLLRGRRDERCFHTLELKWCGVLRPWPANCDSDFGTKPPCFCSIGCMFSMAGRVSWQGRNNTIDNS